MSNVPNLWEVTMLPYLASSPSYIEKDYCRTLGQMVLVRPLGGCAPGEKKFRKRGEVARGTARFGTGEGGAKRNPRSVPNREGPLATFTILRLLLSWRVTSQRGEQEPYCPRVQAVIFLIFVFLAALLFSTKNSLLRSWFNFPQFCCSCRAFIYYEE